MGTQILGTTKAIESYNYKVKTRTEKGWKRKDRKITKYMDVSESMRVLEGAEAARSCSRPARTMQREPVKNAL